MNEGFLDRQIRRTNRNVLVFNLVILGVLLFVAVVTAKYYYNFFLGPFPIASEQFDDQGNPKSLHEFFTIDSINLDPSRFSLDETDHGHTTNYPFYELAIGPKQMLVKMASRSYSGTLTGGLKAVPSEITALFDAKDYQTYYPQMLDATNFRAAGVVGLVVMIPTFFLALWGILKVVRRRGDPSTHPLNRRMALVGDPRQISDEIDRELTGNVRKIGTLQMTDSWLIQESVLGTNLTRAQDLVWAYKKVTTHRTNGVATGKTYTAVLSDRHGKSMEIAMKEAGVGELLGEVSRRAPWVFTGFDKDIQSRFQKDRANFVASVDARRQQVASAPTGAQASAVPIPPPIAGRPVAAKPPVAPPPFPSASPTYTPPASFPPPPGQSSAKPSSSDEPEIGL